MKIAYVLATFPSLTETFILREILALREKGLDIVIFSLRRPASARIHPEARPLLEAVHYRPSLFAPKVMLSQFCFFLRMPCQYLRLFLTIVFSSMSSPVVLLKILRNFPGAVYFAREAKRMNISHIHAHFAFVPADVAMIMAGLLNINFSFSAHAWDIYTQKKKLLAGKMKKADFIVTCTDHGRNYLRKLFPLIPEEKIVMIHHGLAPDKFKPGKAVQPIILGVGRLEEKKGFSYLVEACRILKERDAAFQCIIIGDGSQENLLRAGIREYGLDDRVFLKGMLAQNELMDLYKGAAVFALPAIVTSTGDMDGLPNVILEALAMKIPVISTLVSAIPEIIEDGVNGFLVPSGNPNTLAEKIEELLSDKSLRERMGEKGRVRVSEEFDISKNIEKLVRLFTAEKGQVQNNGK